MNNYSYSRDVAPKDSRLFGPIKTHLPGERFAKDAGVKQTVLSLQPTTDDEVSCPLIQVLVSRWQRSLSVNDDKMEVWCVPSASVRDILMCVTLCFVTPFCHTQYISCSSVSKFLLYCMNYLLSKYNINYIAQLPVWKLFGMYRVIRNDCRSFNNLSYIKHLR
jgi:hypothetical protein